jgi:capsid protein
VLDILLPVPLLPDVVTQENWPAALEYRVYVHMLRDNVNNLVRQHGGNEDAIAGILPPRRVSQWRTCSALGSVVEEMATMSSVTGLASTRRQAAAAAAAVSLTSVILTLRL